MGDMLQSNPNKITGQSDTENQEKSKTKGQS